MDVLKFKLHEPASRNGVILDGFPRTIPQLDAYLKIAPIHLAFNIHMKFDILVSKMLGRRLCSECGVSWNICHIDEGEYQMEPLLPTDPDCKDCPTKYWSKRADDTTETITQRMLAYAKHTEPLLNRFKDMGVLLSFEPKKGVKDYPKMYQLIKPILDKASAF